MDKILPFAGALARARWLPWLGMLVALLILGTTIGLGTLELRDQIRSQMLGRDAEVLDAVAMLEQLGADSPGEFLRQLEDPAGQLTLALRLSRLQEGVMATRLFEASGRLVATLPAAARAASLPPAERARMNQLQPCSRYEPAARLGDYFLVSGASAEKQLPLYTALIPIHAEGQTNLLAVVELIRDGSRMREELARLDGSLARQAWMAFGIGGAILALALGAAFFRLQRLARQLQAHAAELRQANQELAMSAKTSALGAVTAHVIHGLTSPLSSLQNFVNAHAESNGEWKDALASTRRMQDLVGEVVRVLGEQTGGIQYEMPVDELVQVLVVRTEPVASALGTRFEVSVTASGTFSNRQANLVLLILENLVRNALQATPRGKAVRLSVASSGGGTAFEVIDEGTGLPPAVQQHLFTPCRSSKPGGNGIGLALSRHLARQIGAELRLVSTSDAGTTLSLLVPGLPPGDSEFPSGRLEGPQVGASQPDDVNVQSVRWGIVTNERVLERTSMKRNYLLCALGAVLVPMMAAPHEAGAVTYPLTWRWSNPAPHGADIVDSACTSGFAVQVGERGQIFTSTDFNSWIPRDSHTNVFLRGVTFFGGRIVISGESGTILFADDPSEFYYLNLGTSDWLESVAASTNLVVAVGDRGAIYTSTNAVAWTRRSVSFSTWLRGVAWGPPGFVTVGESGFVATSSNGNNWTTRNSGTSAHLNRVAWLGDRFWAVADSGGVLTSTNGNQWSAQSAGATNHLFTMSGSNTGQVLVAGEAEVRLRESGSWTNELRTTKSAPPPAWSYYTSLWDGSSFWMGGRTGLWVEGARTNGSETAWSTVGDSVHDWIWAVTRTPYFYLAVGDRGTILASDNGVDWELDLVPASVTNAVFLGVGGSAERYFAVGSAGAMVHSTNGVTWTAVAPRPTTNDLQGVAAFGAQFVVSGARGTVLTSPNGSNWTRRSTPTANFLSSVAAYPGGLVAVGDNGTILTSPDATNWTSRSISTTNWFYQVRFLNNTLILVGENGAIYSSSNGIQWTNRASGTAQWLTDATYVDGAWFVVGAGGTVLASTNLAAWTSLGAATRNSLFGAAANGGQLLTVGVQGIILRSQILPDRAPVQFVNFARTSGYNLFLIAGKTDQVFLLESSTDLLSWLPAYELEFTDGTGTLLFWEESDPALVREFFRGRLMP